MSICYLCIEHSYDGVEIVSSHKHLKCLQYALEHHHPLSPSLFLHAIYGGDLEIIECLFSTGRYKHLSKHLCISISTNQIHVVKYLVERLGYTVNLTHLIAAIECDLPHIYEYLAAHYPLIPNDKDWIDTVYRACEDTNLHLLEWAYETLAPKPVYWDLSVTVDNPFKDWYEGRLFIESKGGDVWDISSFIYTIDIKEIIEDENHPFYLLLDAGLKLSTSYICTIISATSSQKDDIYLLDYLFSKVCKKNRYFTLSHYSINHFIEHAISRDKEELLDWLIRRFKIKVHARLARIALYIHSHKCFAYLLKKGVKCCDDVYDYLNSRSVLLEVYSNGVSTRLIEHTLRRDRYLHNHFFFARYLLRQFHLRKAREKVIATNIVKKVARECLSRFGITDVIKYELVNYL